VGLDGERRGAANIIYRKEREGERKTLECEKFSELQYVFKDACFPPKCDDRMKIKTSSSDIKLSVAQSFFDSL